MCDHSNESYLAVLSCGIVHYFVQGGSNFFNSVGETIGMTIQMNTTEQY